MDLRLLLHRPSMGNGDLCLTFDDGPNPWATPGILDVLDRFGVRAAFFLLGRNIERHPDLVREMAGRGHIIGNHTYSHSLLSSLSSPKRQKEEVERTEALLASLGVGKSGYYRPPYVLYGRRILRALPDYTFVGVNHYVSDNFIFSPHQMAARMVASIERRGGGIIVLHDGTASFYDRTRRIIADALEEMIPLLRAGGHDFVSLDRLESTKVVIGPDDERRA